FLETPASVQKLFDKLGPRFGQRNGGYTRIVRVGFRKGDGAEEAILELVGSELVKRAADRAKRRAEKSKRCVRVKKAKHHRNRFDPIEPGAARGIPRRPFFFWGIC